MGGTLPGWGSCTFANTPQPADQCVLCRRPFVAAHEGVSRLGGLGQDHCGERGRWGLGKHGLHVASLLLPQLHGTCSQLSNAPLTIFSHHVSSEQSAFEPCGPLPQ